MPSALAHDGVAIEVNIHGSGPTILMHPLPEYAGLYPEFKKLKRELDQALIETLSGRYRLVMFEYPGDAKPKTLTPANVVRDLLAIADAAGAQRFAWCGYSWTAIIGLQLAIATDRLTGLIMGGWPPISGPYKEILDMTGHPSDFEFPMKEAPAPEIEQFNTFYRDLQTFDDLAVQPRITCPRLCIVSSSDHVGGLPIGQIVVDQREKLEELGWDVRIVDDPDHPAPDTGSDAHMDLLEPSVFIPLISDWLDDHLSR